MKKYVTIILIFLLSAATNAGTFFQPKGARALGGSSCYTDLWSVFNNQGAMAFVKERQLGVAYNSHWGIAELASKSCGLVWPLQYANLGISYHHYGFSLYHEQTVSFSIGKKIGRYTGMGIRINSLRTTQKSIAQTNHHFSGDIGIYTIVDKKTSLGIHICNISGRKTNEQLPKRIPVIIRTGIMHEFSPKGNIQIEAEKQLQNKLRFRCGIEYQAGKNIFFRWGICSYPIENSFGLGYTIKKTTTDITASYHPILGYSYLCAISIPF